MSSEAAAAVRKARVRELRERILANCQPVTGLTPAQFREHVEAVVRTIARRW